MIRRPRLGWCSLSLLLVACSESSGGVNGGDVPSPDVDVATPDADVPSPDADVPSPDADVPSLDVPSPDAPSPDADVPSPDADVPSPDVAAPDVPSPDADALSLDAPVPDDLPPEAAACPPSQTRCGDGCADLQTDTAHCGACGRSCGTPANGTARCVASRCAPACVTGFGDCDGDPANGCEVNLASANTHCGACGNACAAGRRCAMGACALDCPAGQTVCGDACVDTATNASHCGRCDQACRVPGGVAGCAAGTCTVASCAAGFGDCDRAAGNGCEVDLTSANAHCSACGRACAEGEACRAGACVVVAQGATCQALRMARPTAPSGTYAIDPDGDGPIALQRVYCDMARDGGGWTLVEVGRALGTSLWTRGAVGAVTHPMQATSAKLARDFVAAILLAGTRTLRIGDETRYGELYLGPLDEAWIRSGLGTTAFGTMVVGRRVAETLGGTQYDGSRFAWPLDGPPAACLNSDGSSAECGAGLHLGTWNHIFSYRGDEIYVNYSSRCCNLATDNGYRVWAR